MTEIPVGADHPAADTANPLDWATMGGICRGRGTTQRRAKSLLREDLFVVLGAMGDRHKDLGDRALLLTCIMQRRDVSASVGGAFW